MPLPYFPFYRDDWRSSTAVQAMSLEEEGAYIRLLSHMWGFEGVCSLPDDEEVLVRIVKTPRRKWRVLRKVLVDGPLSVFESRDGRLYNHRLSEEWEKATTKSRKATAAIQTRYGRSTDVVRTKNERSTDDVPPRDLRSQIPDPEEEEEAEAAGAPARNAWQEPAPEGWGELVEFIRTNRFGWSQTEDTMRQIREWAIDTDCAVVRRAVQEALDNGATGWSYARKCLRDWHDAGARSETDAEALIAERKRRRGRSSRDSPGGASDELRRKYEGLG